jgi:putative transposase
MVLATKHHHGVPTGQHLSYLAQMAGEVHADPWAVLAGRNGKDELLRRLIEYSPQLSFSALVNSLKGVPTRRLGHRYRTRTHHEHRWSPPTSLLPAAAHRRRSSTRT